MVTEAEPRRLHPETVKIVKGTCLRKRRYLTVGEAQKAAKALRMRDGGQVRPYHCPYGSDQDHWHVGNPPSMSDLQAIARAIRDLHGNRPEDLSSTGVDIDLTDP